MTPVALIAAGALVAGPVDSSPFCATLKQVVAAAPAGFDALKPHAPWAGVDNWSTEVQLDSDAMTCSVWTGGNPRSYVCMGPNSSETGGNEARALADRVGACLGVTMATELGSAEPWAGYAGWVRGVAIRVSYDLVIRHTPDQAYHDYYLALRVTPEG